jgi:hypothetical protein
VIISRKVRYSRHASEQLRAAQISRKDDRLRAIEWYLGHDTRLSDVRPVGEKASGGTLYAYQTAATRRHPRLVVYLSISGNMQDIVIEGVMLATTP